MLQIQGQTRWIGHSVTLRSTPEDPNPTLVDQEVPSSILGASTIVFSKLRDIPKTLSASCQHYVSTLTGFGAGTEAPAPPRFAPAGNRADLVRCQPRQDTIHSPLSSTPQQSSTTKRNLRYTPLSLVPQILSSRYFGTGKREVKRRLRTVTRLCNSCHIFASEGGGNDHRRTTIAT